MSLSRRKRLCLISGVLLFGWLGWETVSMFVHAEYLPTSGTKALSNGRVATSCLADRDCTLVNPFTDYTQCTQEARCNEQATTAVNLKSYEQLGVAKNFVSWKCNSSSTTVFGEPLNGCNVPFYYRIQARCFAFRCWAFNVDK